MRLRKSLASWMIRTAHRIYPPKVTEHRSANSFTWVCTDCTGEQKIVGGGGGTATSFGTYLTAGGALPPERRESRGWN